MRKVDRPNEVAAALVSCRSAFVGVALIGALVNILYLTGSFFMLEVYDRVIPSRSMATLVGLGVLALTLYAAQGGLEALRARLLVRIGAAIDQALSGRIIEIVLRGPLRGGAKDDGLLPLRDLDTVRGFLSGTGPHALFDLPWMPLYIAICFLFHPLIGAAAAAGAALLVSLTFLTNLMTVSPTRTGIAIGQQRNLLAEAGRRNAEAIAAMGMTPVIAERWCQANRHYLATQMRVADVAGGFGSASKVSRMALQSAVLALGAYLVVADQATAGIMIASSILTSRALAPAELAIANWKGFVAARQAWRRLAAITEAAPPETALLGLPAPRARLAVETVTVGPPNGPAIVSDASFTLQAGQALGIIGPSASGKSTLARALVGVWGPREGTVRLDGAALDQWTLATLGRHIGFLPQEGELFAGTLAQNISRFEPQPDAADVIAAAQAAGVHEVILRLPNGYETRIGEAGLGLSAGQRQRVGLARALYREPFLVVLDEPNSNLDAEGESALTRAILGVRQRGGICVVIAHRPSALSAVDMILMMANGKVKAFGPKASVLKHVLRPAPSIAASASREASAPAASGDGVRDMLRVQESA